MSILSPSKLAPRAAGSTTDTDNFFNDAFNDDLTSHAPANFGSFSGASGLTESPSTSQAASVASDVISGVVASPETITLQGSGLVFINTYGSGVTDAYRSAIIAAENNFQSHFTNNVTLRVSFDLQLINTNFSGQNSFGQSLVTNVPYSSLRTALINHATTADDIAAVNSLPVTDPSNGLGFDLPIGMARILNLVPAGTGNDDAIVLNSYYWNNSNFSNGVGVLEHEISEGAMGRIGSLGIWDTGNWAPMDLFRYSAVGQRDYTGGSDSRPTYFSVDGTQLLTQFHNSLVYNAAQGRFVYDGYDLADWDHTSGDSFGPGGPNSPGVMTATDLRVMDILGWTPTGSSLSDDYRNSLTDLSHPFGTVAVNGSSTGRLEVVGDRDWFSVQLVAGTTYTISLQGTASGSGTLQDPYLRVHNSAGAVLAENDDSGNTTESLLSFTPGTTGTYYLDAGAYLDGLVGTYRVSVAAPNHAPVLTVASANVAATAGQSFSAASLFSATDVDGDTLSYYLYDGTPGANSGHFVVNGSIVPSEYVYWISAAQLAQTSFVAGAGGTSDELRVIAYDGQTYSNNSVFTYFHVNVANHAPVLTVPSANVAATAHQTLSAASLFGATDADGNLQGYYLYDANSAASSGHFVVNGTVVPSEYVYWISAAQLAQTSFVAGAAGTSDELRVIAYDGQTYSNNSVFTYLHVNVAASPAGPAAGGAPTTGNDNFVFASGLGQKTGVDFSQGFADNHLLHTDLSADHFKQIFGAGVVASIDATSDVGAHREAAVDLLALFGLHATDHTTGHI